MAAGTAVLPSRIGPSRTLLKKYVALSSQRVGLWKVENYSGSGALIDEVNALNASFPGGSNNPLHLPYTRTRHLYLPGVAGNYVSTPDSAALRVTGDIDLRVQMTADDWTPSAAMCLIGKWTGTASTSSYLFFLDTSGKLQLFLSTGAASSNALSSVATGITDGALKWVRVTWQKSDGRTQFFTSDDGSSWTQLGTNVTLSSGITLSANATAVQIGSIGASTSSLAGKIYKAQIYNGIAGTLVFDADFTDESLFAEPYTTLSEKSAQLATLTVNRSASGRKATPVDKARLLFGTDDYLEVADNALLNIGPNDSKSITAKIRVYGTPSAQQHIISKRVGVALANIGWSILLNTSRQVVFSISDGTNGISVTSSALTQGVENIITAVRDTISKTIYLIINGVVAASAADPTTLTITNTDAMRMSRLSGAGTNYGDSSSTGYAVHNRALNARESLLQGIELGP